MKSTAPLDRPVHINLDGDADHEGDTSYIAVIDKDRNMVSFEPSLHSGFGTGVVMGDLGFIFNCRGDYYSLVPGEANALAPGKRPRSTLQSTLVMKDGAAVHDRRQPGGDDQVLRTMQTLLNVVDFGMNVQQAIEAPRWSTRSFPASPFPHTMYPGEMSVEQRVPEAVRTALIARGHKLPRRRRVDDGLARGDCRGSEDRRAERRNRSTRRCLRDRVVRISEFRFQSSD